MTLTTIATCWLCFTGTLSGYAPRPSAGTIAYRQHYGQLPQDLTPYDAVVAVANCDAIGWPGTMTVGGETYSVIAGDCAGADAHAWMVENEIAAEVFWNFWKAHPEYVGTDMHAVIQLRPPTWQEPAPMPETEQAQTTESALRKP